MKLLITLFIVLTAADTFAKSQSLVISGTVPLKAEVTVKNSKEGMKVISKSSPELKVEVRKRQPASIVEVTAP